MRASDQIRYQEKNRMRADMKMHRVSMQRAELSEDAKRAFKHKTEFGRRKCMEMTDEEIVRSYRQAKNKREQIRILADLNCTEEVKIKNIIRDYGKEKVEKPKQEAVQEKPVEIFREKDYGKKKRERKKAVEKKVSIPDCVKNVITDRILVIQCKIDELEQEMSELNDFMTSIRGEADA